MADPVPRDPGRRAVRGRPGQGAAPEQGVDPASPPTRFPGRPEPLTLPPDDFGPSAGQAYTRVVPGVRNGGPGPVAPRGGNGQALTGAPPGRRPAPVGPQPDGAQARRPPPAGQRPWPGSGPGVSQRTGAPLGVPLRPGTRYGPGGAPIAPGAPVLPGRAPGQAGYGAPGAPVVRGAPVVLGAPSATGTAVQYDEPDATASQGRRKVVRDVRYRHVVRRVHVWSVFKVSVVFYACVLVVLLVAGGLLWDAASAVGLIRSLDKLIRSLFALSSFQLHPLTALAWGAAVMGGLCFVGVFVNVVAALLYNLISDIAGGVEVTLVDDQER